MRGEHQGPGRQATAVLGVLVACLIALVVAPGAHAGSMAVTNACQYSYDGYWRDLPVTLSGTPGVASAEPGDGIALGGQSVQAALPEWMAQYGYNFGLLHAGYNEIPATIWVATRGTNTVEGVQVQQVDTVATTTITVGSGGTFVSATPIDYGLPAMANTAWTARGGPVDFKQAGPGSLPQLPVGPNGMPMKPQGSVYIRAELGNASLGLDCLPGSWTSDGAGHTNLVPAPFASVDVPAFDCLSGGVTPVDVDLAGTAAASVASGAAAVVTPSVRYRLPNAYLQQLLTTGVLEQGANDFSATFTAAVDGRNTTEGRQLASGPAAAAVIDVAGSTITVGGASALEGVATLAPTTWSGAGPASLETSAGPPGALGELAVAGVGTVSPYGSVYARVTIEPAGQAARALSLDCVSAVATVANPSIPYTELGNRPGGDSGRFALAGYQLDPFATVPVDPLPYTPPPKDPPRNPRPPDQPPVLPPTPQGPAVAVRSTSLTVKKGKVAVELRCARSTTCRGTVALRTAKKVKVGKRRKVLPLARAASYAIGAGRGKTLRLKLTADARGLLKGRGSLQVKVVVAPRSGRAVTKTLTLRP